MAPTLVAAADYTAQDLLATLRVTAPWWFCLTEHLADPMGDPQLSQLIATQQRLLHDLAHECGVPPQLFNLDLTGEHELSLGAAMLAKHMSPDKHVELVAFVDATMQLLLDGSSRVRELRKKPITTVGSVSGIFLNSGGVPKLPADAAVVGFRGLAGDRQRTRVHHGRAWQALCLWSAEVVDMLHAEGHPIQPGFAGENLSLSGLDWNEVLPGSQLQIGDMLCEISLYALPCQKNKAWFVDGDFQRMHHRRTLGVSRLYASVLVPGSVAVGDQALLR